MPQNRPQARKVTTGTNRKPAPEKREYLNETEQEYEEAIEEQGEEPIGYPHRPSNRNQAQSRKTTRHTQPSSSTHTYREWNDVRFKGFLSKDGIQFKTNPDGDPWCYFTLNVSQGKGKMPLFVRITVWSSDLANYLDENEQYLSGQDHNKQLLVLGQWTMRKTEEGVYYQGMVADHVELVEWRKS